MSRLERWYGADTAKAAAAPQLPPIGARRLISAWLEGLSDDTVKAYRFDLQAFALFVGAGDAEAAMKHLLSRTVGEANLLASEFRNAMRKRGLAPSSINRRLATLTSFTKAASSTGLISWALNVKRLAAQPYRDTRGPGASGVRQMLVAVRSRGDAQGARDRAVVSLMFGRGLRCKEVQGLDLADVDLVRGTVMVLGKMRHQKESLSLAPSTLDAVKEWVKARGREPGPLFVRFSGGGAGAGRLTRQGLYRLVRELGDAVGVRARPHGLRHAGITEALDRGLDVRAVQRFSRHKNVNTVLVYDDNRTDLARGVACAIAGDATTPQVPSSPPASAAALVPVVEQLPSLHELGLKRGEAHRGAKLTAAKVIEIRARYAKGEGPTALAREFGVSVTNVQEIVRRRTWAHVEG